MFHFQIPKCFWLVACVIVVAMAAQVGFAAVPAFRVPVFTGKLTGEAPPPAEPLTLWYRQPAAQWTAALPLGNGKQGAMMFGGVDSEVIGLNEDTLWAGGPYSPENPSALGALPQVRQLLFSGQYRQAESLVSQRMMGRPSTQAAYQPVGDLLLTFPKVETAENYRRELNLRTATASVQFSSGGVAYRRELFASAPDNVMVLRLAASQPGQISFKLSMQTGENIVNSNGTADTFILNGGNRNFASVAGALKFQARARILHAGGKLSKGAREIAGRLPAGAAAAAAAEAEAPAVKAQSEYSLERRRQRHDPDRIGHQLQEIQRCFRRSQCTGRRHYRQGDGQGLRRAATRPACRSPEALPTRVAGPGRQRRRQTPHRPAYP